MSTDDHTIGRITFGPDGKPCRIDMPPTGVSHPTLKPEKPIISSKLTGAMEAKQLNPLESAAVQIAIELKRIADHLEDRRHVSDELRKEITR